jgi:amino acid permease
MSTFTQATPALAGDRSGTVAPDATGGRARRRAMRVTTVITLVSLALLADLLLVRHTLGEEIWGPITAALAALTGLLSLAYLAVRGRNRAARVALYALFATVAFFGFGGYNDHRLALPEGTIDTRPRPPLAPLLFTGMGIAGAVVLRSGSKGD